MPTHLADDSLCLRIPVVADAAAAAEAVRSSLAELMRWTSWCHADYGEEDVERLVRSVADERFEDRAYSFYIHESDPGRILGGCGLYHVDRSINAASLGYWVRSDATGQGIATRAARLLARHGFRDLDLARIEILVAQQNLASQRVAEKLGAVREGLLRRRLKVEGNLVDAVAYSLLPSDPIV
ncbi:MAG TPA: GNAT family protein [Pirellulales bacterium]|nr:GNAT family protein [Pirellulales bacterium]